MNNTSYRMNFLKISLLALSLSTIASCGVGIDDNKGPNEKRVIENQKLVEEYKSVEGIYDGTYNLASENRPVKVKLYLFISQVQEQPDNQNLKPGLRVVLKGRLMQTEVLGDSDNVILEGQYESTTGMLRLDPNSNQSVTARGCRLGGSKSISIEGSVAGDNISAQVESNGQNIGQLKLSRQLSTQENQATVVDEDQEFQRLQKLYKNMLGTFSGQLKREGCEKTKSEKLMAWVYVDRVADGTGNGGQTCYVPKLSIRTSREVQGELADVLYVAPSGFDPQSISPQFQSRVVNAANGSTFLTQALIRTPADGKITGTISTTGVWGTFDLKKVSDEVSAPADESVLLTQRLEKTYAQFIGNYSGKVSPAPGVPFEAWPVQLQVRAQREINSAGIMVPVLHAIYTRPDVFDPSIGRKDMKGQVVVDGCQTQILFKSDATYNTGTVQGIGKMDFAAEVTLANGRVQLKGDLSDHRGYLGVLSVSKKSK